MKFLLFLALILFVHSDDECEAFTNADSCKNHKLSYTDYYCCGMTYKEGPKKEIENSFRCTITPKEIAKMFVDEQTKALYREFMFIEGNGEDFIPNDSQSTKIQIDCKDLNTEIDSSFFSFSEDDKKLINEHCIIYHYQTLEEVFKASYETCKKGELTKYAKDAGFKCVYADINFKSKNGDIENFQTCFPFSKEDIKKGKLNELLKSYLDEVFSKEIFPGESDPNYDFKVKGDGISASYDSKTGKLNKSDMIKINMYLILLFLILF